MFRGTRPRGGRVGRGHNGVPWVFRPQFGNQFNSPFIPTPRGHIMPGQRGFVPAIRGSEWRGRGMVARGGGALLRTPSIPPLIGEERVSTQLVDSKKTSETQRQPLLQLPIGARLGPPVEDSIKSELDVCHQGSSVSSGVLQQPKVEKEDTKESVKTVSNVGNIKPLFPSVPKRYAASGNFSAAQDETESKPSDAKVARLQDNEDEPSFDQNLVILDWYNSDLNLMIEKSDFCSAKAISKRGFGLMWAGARATFGVQRGRVCYEVRVDANCNTDHLEGETTPNVLRCGWSIDSPSLQLGEIPFSYGYGGTGKASVDGKFMNYGLPFSVGDVVGCYLDMTVDPIIIRFTMNGKDQGVCFRIKTSELKGRPLFPHILTKNQDYSVNFGQLVAPQRPLLPNYIPIGQIDIEDGLVRGPCQPSSRAKCQVLMMIGLSGAGKTHWANEFSRKHPEKRFNILGTNALLEKMKVQGLHRKRNYCGRWDVLIQKCSTCFDDLLQVASKRRRNIILDQTNVFPTARRRKLAPFKGMKITAIVMVPDHNVFLSRIRQLEAAEGKNVPDDAILNMKANFTLPEAEESYFSSVMFVDQEPNEAGKLVTMYNDEATNLNFEVSPGVKAIRARIEKQRQMNNDYSVFGQRFDETLICSDSVPANSYSSLTCKRSPCDQTISVKKEHDSGRKSRFSSDNGSSRMARNRSRSRDRRQSRRRSRSRNRSRDRNVFSRSRHERLQRRSRSRSRDQKPFQRVRSNRSRSRDRYGHRDTKISAVSPNRLGTNIGSGSNRVTLLADPDSKSQPGPLMLEEDFAFHYGSESKAAEFWDGEFGHNFRPTNEYRHQEDFNQTLLDQQNPPVAFNQLHYHEETNTFANRGGFMPSLAQRQSMRGGNRVGGTRGPNFNVPSECGFPVEEDFGNDFDQFSDARRGGSVFRGRSLSHRGISRGEFSNIGVSATSVGPKNFPDNTNIIKGGLDYNRGGDMGGCEGNNPEPLWYSKEHGIPYRTKKHEDETFENVYQQFSQTQDNRQPTDYGNADHRASRLPVSVQGDGQMSSWHSEMKDEKLYGSKRPILSNLSGNRCLPLDRGFDPSSEAFSSTKAFKEGWQMSGSIDGVDDDFEVQRQRMAHVYGNIQNPSNSDYNSEFRGEGRQAFPSNPSSMSYPSSKPLPQSSMQRQQYNQVQRQRQRNTNEFDPNDEMSEDPYLYESRPNYGMGKAEEMQMNNMYNKFGGGSRANVEFNPSMQMRTQKFESRTAAKMQSPPINPTFPHHNSQSNEPALENDRNYSGFFQSLRANMSGWQDPSDQSRSRSNWPSQNPREFQNSLDDSVNLGQSSKCPPMKQHQSQSTVNVGMRDNKLEKIDPRYGISHQMADGNIRHAASIQSGVDERNNDQNRRDISGLMYSNQNNSSGTSWMKSPTSAAASRNMGNEAPVKPPASQTASETSNSISGANAPDYAALLQYLQFYKQKMGATTKPV